MPDIPAVPSRDTGLRSLPLLRRRLWFIAAASAGAFLLLLLSVETGITGHVDRSFVLWTHRSFGRAAYGLFAWITNLGSTQVRVPVIVAIIVVAAAFRRRHLAILTIAITGGVALLTELVKLAVDRPRPKLFPHPAAAGASFPSGHASNTLALALAVIIVAWCLPAHRSISIAVTILAIAIAALVGLSRIVLGVHYLTDVVAGYALAAGWAAICLALASMYLREFRAHTGIGGWHSR